MACEHGKVNGNALNREEVHEITETSMPWQN